MTVPIILDRGDAATVGVVQLKRTPYLGMRFEYGGAVWQVSHAGDHVRGWVAEPLPLGEAALFSKPSARGSHLRDGRARGACGRW